MDVGEVLLFVGLSLVALQARHIITYTGAFLGLLFWGLGIADDDLTTGLAICILAGYMLYAAINWFWSRA